MVNPDLFTLFVREHQAMVYSTALYLLGDSAEAEDIAQAVFIKAYANFAAANDCVSPRAWLKTVTRNLSLNHLTRYRFRWRFFSELAGTVATAQGEAGEGETPYEQSIAGESPLEESAFNDPQQFARLHAAIAALPSMQRVVVALFYFHEMSQAQISKELKISSAKVRVDLFRAREALRKVLESPRI